MPLRRPSALITVTNQKPIIFGLLLNLKNGNEPPGGAGSKHGEQTGARLVSPLFASRAGRAPSSGVARFTPSSDWQREGALTPSKRLYRPTGAETRVLSQL